MRLGGERIGRVMEKLQGQVVELKVHSVGEVGLRARPRPLSRGGSWQGCAKPGTGRGQVWEGCHSQCRAQRMPSWSKTSTRTEKGDMVSRGGDLRSQVVLQGASVSSHWVFLYLKARQTTARSRLQGQGGAQPVLARRTPASGARGGRCQIQLLRMAELRK